jgi:putative toxin-antitoxin system antitoxin component (TIGR02293 family)
MAQTPLSRERKAGARRKGSATQIVRSDTLGEALTESGGTFYLSVGGAAAKGQATDAVSEIRIFSRNFAPAGWGEGQLLPISENDALFALLGTSYGGGGQSTFDLPDLVGRVPMGTGPEHEAGELLKAARTADTSPSIRGVWRQFEESVFGGAVEAIGGAQAIGMAVRDEADLLRAIGLGFPVRVLASLRERGFRGEDLEAVVAPRRTLARRKAAGHRLTRTESDAAWRLAHVFALGARVLKGPEAALAWLRRPKSALSDQKPMDLIDTAVGAQAVERLLFQLEWGDVA